MPATKTQLYVSLLHCCCCWLAHYQQSKNVYYLSSNGVLIERQASSANPQSWKDSNLSYLYGASNSTSLTAYWNQNRSDSSQELVVLFQKEESETSITQARYTSNNVTENRWVVDVLRFSHPIGSTFATSLADYRGGKHIVLYNVNDDKALQQYDYTINNASITSGSAVSVNTGSGEQETHHSGKSSHLLTRQPRYRSTCRTTIAFSSHCSKQFASFHG